MEDVCWTQRAAKLFCVCVYFCIAYLSFTYLLPIVAPFLVAFCVAFAVSAIARRLKNALHLPYSVCAALVVTALLLLVGAVAFYVCRALLIEVRRTLSALSVSDFSWILEIVGQIPVISELSVVSDAQTANELYSVAARMLSALSSHLATFLGTAIRATPSVLLSGVVTVIACYYMSIDFDRICTLLRSFLPRAWGEGARKVKAGALRALVGYVRAYLLLFVLTFAAVFAGLMLLCPSHAWLGALTVAAVDILPVLGAGAVLIPWGIFSIVGGDYFLGFGLIILYLAVTVIRQIAEPKIIGESIGFHPLCAMMAMFLGYKLFGFVGMLLSPVAVAVTLNAVKKE